jgi:hypothetical protein
MRTNPACHHDSTPTSPAYPSSDYGDDFEMDVDVTLTPVAIPRVYFTQCNISEFENVRLDLEARGFSIFEPIIQRLPRETEDVCNITYIRADDVNSVALTMLEPGDASE